MGSLKAAWYDLHHFSTEQEMLQTIKPAADFIAYFFMTTTNKIKIFFFQYKKNNETFSHAHFLTQQQITLAKLVSFQR